MADQARAACWFSFGVSCPKTLRTSLPGTAAFAGSPCRHNIRSSAVSRCAERNVAVVLGADTTKVLTESGNFPGSYFL